MPFFNLSPDELEVLRIPTEGQGGFQGLIERLQNNILDEETGRLYVSQDDIARIKEYYNRYGGGGFQGRLIQIFSAHIDFDS